MATFKTSYAVTNTAMTITLASLANVSARESTAVSNATDLFLDVMLSVRCQTSLLTGTDNAIYIYAYGSDDGTTYTWPCTGSDAAVLTTRTNFNLLKVINILDWPYTSTAFQVVIPSLATAFGGVLPLKWGVVVDNRSGGALTASTSNNYINFTGIYNTST